MILTYLDFGVRRRLADADLRLKCALELLVPQLFALLQLVQLWCVLTRLSQPPDDVDSSGSNFTARAEDAKSALTGRLGDGKCQSNLAFWLIVLGVCQPITMGIVVFCFSCS